MDSDKAKREDVHPAIHIESVTTAPAEHQPAVKVGGLEFSSGMQQQQKDTDTESDKHSSHQGTYTILKKLILFFNKYLH